MPSPMFRPLFAILGSRKARGISGGQLQAGDGHMPASTRAAG